MLEDPGTKGWPKGMKSAPQMVLLATWADDGRAAAAKEAVALAVAYAPAAATSAERSAGTRSPAAAWGTACCLTLTILMLSLSPRALRGGPRMTACMQQRAPTSDGITCMSFSVIGAYGTYLFT